MNPLSLIPEKVRLALYVAYGLIGPVLIYTSVKGWTGEAEFTLYAGIGAVLNFTAASNVSVGGNVLNATVESFELGGEYVGEHRAPLEG